MAIVSIAEREIDLPRNAGLLDTNVLVAFVNDRDSNHENALLVLEDNQFTWVVTVPVIVEAAGVLGSRRGHEHVLKLLAWAIAPGNFLIIPSTHVFENSHSVVLAHAEWMAKYVIDYIDAHLMELADIISRSFASKPSLPIFTFDTKDFMKCALRGKAYSLYDMRELQMIDFDIS